MAHFLITLWCHIADVWENLFNVSTEEFFSKKITNKLVQQLQVALVSWLLGATARSAKRVLAIVILSVRLFVCHDPVPIQAQVR